MKSFSENEWFVVPLRGHIAYMCGARVTTRTHLRTNPTRDAEHMFIRGAWCTQTGGWRPLVTAAAATTTDGVDVNGIQSHCKQNTVCLVLRRIYTNLCLSVSLTHSLLTTCNTTAMLISRECEKDWKKERSAERSANDI